MRLRNKPWARDKLLAHPQWVIQNPEKWKGHWKDIFGNERDIHIEIGTGKGKFIVEMAKAHPEINFIGIERYTSVIVTALDRLLEAGVDNLRLLNVDARDLESYFAPGEICRIYLNFSDPWPKKRHEKRRLTYRSYLEIYQRLLKPEGGIHLKTDNQGFFEYSLVSMSRFGMVLEEVSLDLHRSDFAGNIMTEYEEKFSQKGNRIYRLEARFRKE
jgi:tRNA (guanine-N(7)-)-methyltransferase (EC 2.1.1.33)